MKKVIFFLYFVLFGLFLAPWVFAAEKIDNFEVAIEINEDSSIKVRERIDYNFGFEQKHGIFREIPIKYKRGQINYNLRIFGIRITDENGQKYNFSVSRPGRYVKIKIGDKDKFVTGEKTYIISYKVKRAINYFDDHDELYWNVTGNDWDVLIENAEANVNFNGFQVKDPDIQEACFAGPLGSTQKCDKTRRAFYSQGFIYPGVIIFEQKNLSPGQGLTVVVGWPKGLVTKPSIIQSVFYTLLDNWVLLMPVMVCVIMLFLWFKLGRDPKGRGTIIAQYDSPDDLTPIEVGTIVDETVDRNDISSEIIYLATKGYLKIYQAEKTGLFGARDFVLQKLKEGDNQISEFDRKLMESLFGDKEMVALSSLKNDLNFRQDLIEITNQIYNSTVGKDYFPKSPTKVRAIYLIIGSIVVFLAIPAGYLSGVLGVISTFFSGMLIIIFGSRLMPVRTKKGVLAKEHILGLKQYLSVAEKDRLTFHNAPEKKPEHFEALLPYAMVLGVEREWAKQFEGIYNQQPGWYVGPVEGRFSPTVFVGDLGIFQKNTNATFYPRGAASGGSGFGGGGFSGGGFGGGGGGSW